MNWQEIFEKAFSILEFFLGKFNWWQKLKEIIRDVIITVEEAHKLQETEEWDKRSKAIEKIIEYLENLGIKFPFSTFILKVAVGILVDSLVQTLNHFFGHDWIKYIPEI